MTIHGVACKIIQFDPLVSSYDIDGIEFNDALGRDIQVEWYDDVDINSFHVLNSTTDYHFGHSAPINNGYYNIYTRMTIAFTSSFMTSMSVLPSNTNPYFKVSRHTQVTQSVEFAHVTSNLNRNIESCLDKITKILQELVCADQNILKYIPDIKNIQVDVKNLKAADLTIINHINVLDTSVSSLGNISSGHTTSIATLVAQTASNSGNLTTAMTDIHTLQTNLGTVQNQATTTAALLATLSQELTTLKTLLPTPTNKDLQLTTYLDGSTIKVGWLPKSSNLPATTGATAGQMLAVKDPVTGTFEYITPPNGLPDTKTSTAGSLVAVKTPSTGEFELVTLGTAIARALQVLSGTTGALAENRYILKVDDTGAAKLIVDPLPSGTFAEQGNAVVLKNAPNVYELKKIIGLPDPSSAQAGQAVTLVDPQLGTYQYSDVLYGTTSGATKNSVLVLDDETFATTAFLSPANFIEGQLRTVLGTADADNVPAGDYVITIKADGTATYSLSTAGAEDIDQNTGIVSGLHLVTSGTSLSKIRIEPGVAQFVANVEGRPNAKTILYELKTAIDLTLPTTPKEYFIYINSTGVASYKEVNMTSPRGNEVCIGSVRVDKDNGIVRIGQSRRKVDNVQAQIYEFYQNLSLTNALSGGNLSLSTTSPTNQIRITGGRFIRDGGYPSLDTFFQTPFSDRNPMKWRFLTNDDYSGVFSEFPKAPPTFISGAVADLPVGRWGYYLLFVDVRHDPEVNQVADPTKVDTGCTITVLPAFQTYGTKPNGTPATLFSTYYNANSGKIPQELSKYGKVFGLLIYKGNSDLNDPDNTLTNVSVSNAVSTSTGTNLPSGTTSDVGKALTLLNSPDTYGFTNIISDELALNTSLISGCAVTKVGTTGLNFSVSAGKVLFVEPTTAGLSSTRTIVDIAAIASKAIPPLEGTSYIVAKKDKSVVIETIEPLGTRGDKCLIAIVQHSANDILNIMNVADKGDSVVGQLREIKNATEPALHGCDITMTGKSFNITKGSYFGRGIEANTVNPDDGVVITASTGAKFMFFDQDGKVKAPLTEFPDTAIVELTKGTLTPEEAGKWYYYPMFVSPSGELHIQYAVKQYDTKASVPNTRKFLDEYMPTVPALYKRYFAFRGLLLKEGGQPILSSNRAMNYNSYIEDLNASATVTSYTIPTPTVADANKVLGVDASGSYALQTASGGSTDDSLPANVLADGTTLVANRATAELTSLTTGKDLFNDNTARGKFITTAMDNSITDSPKIGLSHFSSDFSGRTVNLGSKADIILGDVPKNNVWHTSEGFSQRSNFVNRQVVGTSFIKGFDVSSQNHTASPIILRPKFEGSFQFCLMVGIKYLPAVLGERITAKVFVNSADLTTISNTALIHIEFRAFIDSDAAVHNTYVVFNIENGGISIYDKERQIDIVRNVTKSNFSQKLQDYLTANPTLFSYKTPAISTAQKISFDIGIYAFGAVTTTTNTINITNNNINLELQINSDATSTPTDHKAYDMGTIKSWLADATTVTNANLTITAGKKLVATLSQLKSYAGIDTGYIFSTSRYGANMLPTLNLTKPDGTATVRFIPKALSSNDIVYISEVPVTQAEIDTYIIRVRINSLDTDPLVVNTKNNIKVSFVDADKF